MSETLEVRVAVLQQIARETREALTGIRADIRELTTEVRNEMRDVRSEIRDLRADYRWLLGIMLGMGAGLLGAMAKGFHWL